jgi:hypothetical protein
MRGMILQFLGCYLRTLCLTLPEQRKIGINLLKVYMANMDGLFRKVAKLVARLAVKAARGSNPDIMYYEKKYNNTRRPIQRGGELTLFRQKMMKKWVVL